jgi:hypothetical protein
MTEQLTEKCTALNLKAFAAHMAEALSYAQQKNWFAQKILLHLLDSYTTKSESSSLRLLSC